MMKLPKDPFDPDAYNGINIALCVLCILVHGLGIVLLVKLWKRNAQQLMIINLSVAELLTSILRLVVISCAQYLGPPKFLPPGAPKPTKPPHIVRTEDALHYSSTLAMTGMFFVIFLIMIFLMVDRALVVILKGRYNKVCSILNTSIAMAFCWIVGIIMLIAFPLARHIHDYKHNEHFEYHIYTVCDVIFMVVAIVSYVIVLSMYSGYQVQEDQLDGDEQAEDASTKSGPGGSWTVIRTMKMPRFYIPLLILLTYFFFVILPHWIYIGDKYPKCEGPPPKCIPNMDPWRAMIQLLIIGYLSDAVVYIFLQPDVRALLARWFGCGKKQPEPPRATFSEVEMS